MNRRLAVLVVLAAIPLGAAAPAPAEWMQYKAPDGSYTIDLPGMPRVFKGGESHGGIRFEIQTATVNRPDAIYSVKILDANPNDRLLARDMVSYGGGPLGGDTIFDNDGYEGDHLVRDVFVHRGAVWERVHVIEMGTRAYRIGVMMRADYTKEPEIMRFFNSFKLSPK